MITSPSGTSVICCALPYRRAYDTDPVVPSIAQLLRHAGLVPASTAPCVPRQRPSAEQQATLFHIRAAQGIVVELPIA